MTAERSKVKKPKPALFDGCISAQKIANSIAGHQTKTRIGAHDIFLGQVRADKIDGKLVAAIEYTAYREMAEKEFHAIRERAFGSFDLTCAHIYHSLGRLKVGEICLFVFTSSVRRYDAMEACRYIVEEIKTKVPVFAREIFEDQSYQWKENTAAK